MNEIIKLSGQLEVYCLLWKHKNNKIASRRFLQKSRMSEGNPQSKAIYIALEKGENVKELNVILETDKYMCSRLLNFSVPRHSYL